MYCAMMPSKLIWMFFFFFFTLIGHNIGLYWCIACGMCVHKGYDYSGWYGQNQQGTGDYSQGESQG